MTCVLLFVSGQDLETGVDDTGMPVASIYRPTNATNKIQIIEHNSR